MKDLRRISIDIDLKLKQKFLDKLEKDGFKQRGLIIKWIKAYLEEEE